MPFGGQRLPERLDLAPRRKREGPLAPAAQRERNRAAHTLHERDEIGEAFFDEPIDLRVGIDTPDVGDGRHVVDDVTERRHANEQYLLHAERKKKGTASQGMAGTFTAPSPSAA